MGTNQIFELIDLALTDDKIINDLKEELWEDRSSEDIEFELNGDLVVIPKTAEITILTKAVFKRNYGIGFGIYRVQVSIGRTDINFGEVVTSEYCFATLYYNEECKFLSLDLYKDL